METCNDCLHFETCRDWAKTLAGVDVSDVPSVTKTVCHAFKDRSLFLELPCKPGAHLWRITTPYRGEPKVTEFVVKNFRTAGQRRRVQIEVQAVNVPGPNWMRYQDFFRTAEEAKKALAERREANGA